MPDLRASGAPRAASLRTWEISSWRQDRAVPSSSSERGLLSSGEGEGEERGELVMGGLGVNIPHTGGLSPFSNLSSSSSNREKFPKKFPGKIPSAPPCFLPSGKREKRPPWEKFPREIHFENFPREFLSVHCDGEERKDLLKNFPENFCVRARPRSSARPPYTSRGLPHPL